jgi:hypothetical protein
MGRKINVLKDRQAKVDNTLGKYNYGTGFGWCAKREKKRAKASGTGKSILGRR